jgi:DNA-directed RNA polymerase subunit RPC12/RpoP
MFNVCYHCGLYRADKRIDPAGPYAICPECGHKHLFRRLPLFIVSGASGTGKSTVCQTLAGIIQEAVLLDADILWRPEFDRPDDGYRDFFELWLRLCKNITQSGRPVLLFGAGVGVPDNMEPRIERRYFSTLHYLALTCADEELTARLRRRPDWRTNSNPAFLEAQLRFNHWFQDNAPHITPPITLLDTTNHSIQETATQITNWLYKNLKVSGGYD